MPDGALLPCAVMVGAVMVGAVYGLRRSVGAPFGRCAVSALRPLI